MNLENRCSCIWPEMSEDSFLGHSNDTVHHCNVARDQHKTGTLMLVDTPIPQASDDVRIHSCACGLNWIERTKLEKRIQ